MSTVKFNTVSYSEAAGFFRTLSGEDQHEVLGKLGCKPNNPAEYQSMLQRACNEKDGGPGRLLQALYPDQLTSLLELLGCKLSGSTDDRVKFILKVWSGVRHDICAVTTR